MRGEITKFDLSPFKKLDCHNSNGVFGDEHGNLTFQYERQYESAAKIMAKAATVISSSSSSSQSYDHHNHLYSKLKWNEVTRKRVQQTTANSGATRRPNSILFAPPERHELDQSKPPVARNNREIHNNNSSTGPRAKWRIKRAKTGPSAQSNSHTTNIERSKSDEEAAAEARNCEICSVTHQNRRDNGQLPVAADHSCRLRSHRTIQSNNAGPGTGPKERHIVNNYGVGDEGSNSKWTNGTTVEPQSNQNVAASAAAHHHPTSHRHLLQCDDVTTTEYHNLSLQQAAPCLKAANSITSRHKDTTSGGSSISKGKDLRLLSSSRLDSKHSATTTTMPSSTSSSSSGYEKRPSESNCGRAAHRNLSESNSMAMAALNLAAPSPLPPPAAAAAAVRAPLSVETKKTTMTKQQQHQQQQCNSIANRLHSPMSAAAASSSSQQQKHNHHHDCCCCSISRCGCSHDEDIDSKISRKGSITSQRRNVSTTESNDSISAASNHSNRKIKLPSLRNFSMFKSRLRGLCVRLTDFKHTTNATTTANCNAQSSFNQHTCNRAKSADNDPHCFAPTSRCVCQPVHEDMPNIDIYEPAINNVEPTSKKQRAFPSYSFESSMQTDDINNCAHFRNDQFIRNDQTIEQEAAQINPALDANTYRHSEIFITDNNLSNFLNQQLQSINFNESDSAPNANDPPAAEISDSAIVSTSSSSDNLPRAIAVPVPDIESQDAVPVLTSPDRALLTHFMEIFERIMSKMAAFETFIPSEIEDIACHLLRLCASVGDMRLIGHAIIAQELNFYDGEALNDSILSYLKSIRDAFYSILLLRQENVDSYYFCINGFDITYLVASKFDTMFIFVLQQCKDFTSLDEMCDSEQITQNSLAS